jgi:hypothetical protein
MATKLTRRAGWALVVVIGIGLGILLGLLVLPPGGPDPFVEPSPSVSVSP